jgi:hypothetical protein
MNLEQIGLGLASHKDAVQGRIFLRLSLFIRLQGCTHVYHTEVNLYGRAEEVHRGMGTVHRVVTVMDTKEIGGEEMNKVLEALEPFHSLMLESDLNHIKKIKLVQNNPIPKVAYKDDGTRRSKKIGKNWKKFMYWVEAWDAFCESLE